MNEKLFRDQLQKRIYGLGYLVFGEKSGGAMTSNLLKCKGGMFDTMDALIAAIRAGGIADGSRARDYIGGVLRKCGDDLNKVPIGTRMGNYEWDGGKWGEINGAPKKT